MVAWFQSIIGKEARRQIMEKEGRLPTRIYACVGGGSNAMGIFSGFFDDPVELIGVEAGGKGPGSGLHASRLAYTDSTVGIAQCYKTYFLQNNDGQMNETHSVAAGLDYVGVSPILASLRDSGRVRFEAATDSEVLEALTLTLRKEGLIPALESAHAFVQAFKEAALLNKDDIIIINQSGRGDKDIFTVADAFRDPAWMEFIKRRRGIMALKSYIREKLKKKDILLMTHIVLGYPDLKSSLETIRTMVEAGVDIMELQIPFSEPTADGPVIVHANQKAIEKGTTVAECLKTAGQASRAFDIPFLIMSYYNIPFKYGVERFASAMAGAGLKGAIIADLPPEEGMEYLAAMQKNNLEPIMLFSPTTPSERMRFIASFAKGFIYCVARRGHRKGNSLFKGP